MPLVGPPIMRRIIGALTGLILILPTGVCFLKHPTPPFFYHCIPSLIQSAQTHVTAPSLVDVNFRSRSAQNIETWGTVHLTTLRILT